MYFVDSIVSTEKYYNSAPLGSSKLDLKWLEWMIKHLKCLVQHAKKMYCKNRLVIGIIHVHIIHLCIRLKSPESRERGGEIGNCSVGLALIINDLNTTNNRLLRATYCYLGSNCIFKKKKQKKKQGISQIIMYLWMRSLKRKVYKRKKTN